MIILVVTGILGGGVDPIWKSFAHGLLAVLEQESMDFPFRGCYITGWLRGDTVDARSLRWWLSLGVLSPNALAMSGVTTGMSMVLSKWIVTPL